MENIIITSKGFTVDNFYFEKFILSRGEYLSIDFPENLDLKFENALYEILSGNRKVEDVSVVENIIPVKTPKVKLGPALFFSKTSFKYLKENSLLRPEELMSLLKEIDIDPKINIYRLGANERKLLTLEAAYSKSKNIIISASDLDYNGLERVRNRIMKEIDNGSLIEINYPSSKGREYIITSLGIRQKKIIVKSVG